jgi:uncharacterized protein YbjT (DUF2867 family)
MRILVTGASGFVGSLLVPRLLLDGHAVRALGRDPARVAAALAGTFPDGAADGTAEIDVLRGDALTGDGLASALAHVDVAYYLIHSMERPSAKSSSQGSPMRLSSQGSPARLSAQGSPTRLSSQDAPTGFPSPRSFPERERVAARNFADASARAGVQRIVYLGGIMPRERALPASPHLASRETVEQILLDAVPDSVALRASIVIGARSRSFRFLVRLVERLPILTLPAWRSFRTQPIDERDITEMLAAAATTAAPAGRSLDVAGPDVLTYGEMISRIAELMMIRRPVLGFGVNITPVAARVAAAIATEDPALILPLMESLQGDLLPRGSGESGGDERADDRQAERGQAHLSPAELLGVDLHSFDSAVEHALREWEETEPLAAR